MSPWTVRTRPRSAAARGQRPDAGIDVDADDGGALRYELARDRRADPAGGAGDDRRLVRQVHRCESLAFSPSAMRFKPSTSAVNTSIGPSAKFGFEAR